MRKAAAEKMGYEFTGVYERLKEKVLERKEEFKKKGYKTFIVEEDGGYCLYAEKKYFKDSDIARIQNVLATIETQKAVALEQYQKTLQNIEKEKVALEKLLKEIMEQ